MSNVCIVLVETSHPGNIGAVARAMMNMGLGELRLVKPAQFPHAKATARASGAVGVLEQAQVFDTFAAAIADCQVVVGASARKRNIAWPEVNPRECAVALQAREADVRTAIVFGRERTGLSNEELDQCHQMLHIPCNPDFSSLNVAMAVQVVSYEIRMAGLDPDAVQDVPEDEAPATQDELNRFYEHLDDVVVATGFLDPQNPRQLRRRLRRLFNRAAMSRVEVNILRGVLTSVQKLLGGDR